MVARAAIDDLKRMHADCEIDLIAITGDIAKKGRADEYELAHDWLIDPLREELDLDVSRFALVPGNHDVDRSAIDKYQEKGLRAALVDPSAVAELLADESSVDQALSRLEPWNDYYGLLMDSLSEQSAAGLGRTRRLEIRGVDVGIAALNSSWRSYDDNDKGFILLGEPQVKAALSAIEDADLRIVLMHHPYPWLASFDADRARSAIERARTLVLSGHDHKPDPTAEFSLRGGAIYSRAGCLYERLDKLNGYTLVDVDLAEGTVRFRLRTWFPQREAFDQAVHLPEGGLAEMAWVGGRMLPVRADYSTVLQGLGERASELSLFGMLDTDLDAVTPDSVLVEPRLWPAPYADIAAARDLDAAGEEPEAEDPLLALDRKNVLIVSGDPESGVSGGLLWILTKHFDTRGTHTPFPTSLSRNFKAAQFERSLRQNANAAGQHVGAQKPVPPSIVAIDDIGGGGPAFRELVSFAMDHPEHLFVLGCHEADLGAIVEGLERRDVSFTKLHVGPLGRAQVRALMNKIGGLTDTDIDQIFGFVVNQHLPRTPLMIAALIVAVQENRDPSSFGQSALLNACIQVLLRFESGGNDGDTHLEPIHREDLLAWFAGQMSREGKDRMTARASEEEFAAYFRDRGWGERIGPGDVLSGLVGRRVLLRDDSGVGFRHEAFQELFTGKRINGDISFAHQILVQPFDHANAIGHAAGLRRNDRELLAAIHREATTVFDRADPDIDIGLFDRIKDEKGWSDGDPDLEMLNALLEERDLQDEPDQDHQDREIERFYDDLEYDEEDEQVPREDFKILSELEPAANLLSVVLRSSELVPDVDLKLEALKTAIHGWSLVAIVMAVTEDQASELRDRIEDGDLAAVVEANPDSAARVAELMITMVLGIAVTGTLASPHLEEVARRALEDDEFVSSTAHALFATMFYVLMRFDRWDLHVMRLDEQHGGHPIVKHLVFALASAGHRSPEAQDAEVATMEKFLADRLTPEEVKEKGGHVASTRRSHLLQELRTGRQKALMARKLRQAE